MFGKFEKEIENAKMYAKKVLKCKKKQVNAFQFAANPLV